MKVLVFDRQKCSGAHTCESTCAQAWFKSDAVEFSSIRIRQEESGFRATFCIQCGECIAVCPTNALYRDKQGIVRLRKADCVGCLTCVGFCPYLAMQYTTKDATPFKCVSCGQCVKNCPTQALSLVETEDLETLPQVTGI